MKNQIIDWIPILKSSDISEKYYSDVINIINDIHINNDYYLNSDYCDYCKNLTLITLRVLSKIDLSKVEFVTDKNKCNLITNNVSINKFDYPYNQNIDIKNLLMCIISDEIINYIENEISKTGGVFVHNIIENFVEMSDITTINTTYYFRSRISNYNNRYVKILKLKEKICQNKNHC